MSDTPFTGEQLSFLEEWYLHVRIGELTKELALHLKVAAQIDAELLSERSRLREIRPGS